MKRETFECVCFHPEHRLIFTIDPEDKDNPFFCVEIFLSDAPWYTRIWHGIRYILGYKSKYGHFGEWLLREEDIAGMLEILQNYKLDLKLAKGGKNGD